MNRTDWTSRRRVEAALDHKEPDRVPFDLGGTVVTGIHERAYRRLRRHLGLPTLKIEIDDTIQQLGRLHDDLKERLDIDVDGIRPGPPRDFTLSHREEDGYDKIRDEWGIEWWRPLDGGLYYDMRVHPLADIESAAESARIRFPDPLDAGRFQGFADRADRLMNEQQQAYVLGANVAGVFEMAVWLRGFNTFFRDLLVNRPVAEAILDIVCEAKMKYWQRALELLGRNVMIVHEGDDFAGQDRLLIAPELYREIVKPRHTRIFSFIKKIADADVRVFFHSCGAMASLIPDLIESGIDILNPVQVSARGMDTRELKRLYGNDIVFYGGGVDTQRVLPHGTPAEVRDEVRRRIDDLAPGGGFIFATVHNIQADVPPENIMAMWETLRECGVYS